jgi:hypothetical protein
VAVPSALPVVVPSAVAPWEQPWPVVVPSAAARWPRRVVTVVRLAAARVAASSQVVHRVDPQVEVAPMGRDEERPSRAEALAPGMALEPVQTRVLARSLPG